MQGEKRVHVDGPVQAPAERPAGKNARTSGKKGAVDRGPRDGVARGARAKSPRVKGAATEDSQRARAADGETRASNASRPSHVDASGRELFGGVERGPCAERERQWHALGSHPQIRGRPRERLAGDTDRKAAPTEQRPRPRRRRRGRLRAWFRG